MKSIPLMMRVCVGAFMSAGVALAVPTEQASLNTCQKAVKVATAQFVGKKIAAIGTCLQAISTQMVQNNAVDASAAALTCVTQFRKLSDSRSLGKSLPEKLSAGIARKCTPGGNNTHTLGDVLGVGATVSQPLNANDLGTWCSHFGGTGTINTLQDWMDCLSAAAECDVDAAIAAQYPRGLDWLGLVRPSMLALTAPVKDPNKITDAVAGLDAVKAEIDGPDNDNVVSLQCGGIVASGTAAPGDVLTGKTFSSSTASGLSGTMPNNGAVTLSPSTSDQSIAAGYHNGAGKCVGDPDLVSDNIKRGVNLFGVAGSPSVVETSSATATAADVLSGKTAYVNGSQVTGSVPAGSNVTGTNGSLSMTIPDALYGGSKTATAVDTNLAAGNIKSGATIFGVGGTVIQASGNAVAGEVLASKTFSNASGAGTGTMPNNGAVTLTPGTSNQTIAAGYHNGSGYCAGDTNLVTGNIKSGVTIFGVNGNPNVVNTSSGTAAAGDLLSSKIAWVAGAQVTGTMPNNDAVNITPSTSTQTIPAGYHNGLGSVAGDTNLVPGNVKSGASIFGIAGSVLQASGTAVPSNVLFGVTFSNASGAWTGSMPNNSGFSLWPDTADQVVPIGFHDGTTKVKGDINLASSNIKSGVSIFGVAGSSSVVDTSGANAAAVDMGSGKTAYVNGSLVTGTVPAGSNVSGANGAMTFTIPDGLYSGSKTATANDSNLVGGNIVSGTSVFGVAGTQLPSQPLRTGQTADYGTNSDGNLQKGDTRQLTDNGDGTITDNKTGLMWEKKDQAAGGIHNFNNSYTWSGASYGGTNVMDGTVTTTFLATLNAGAGFAGHTDWRIPNLNEMLSLVNYQNVNPAIDAAFNTSCAASCTVLTCSCTQSDGYWSSTTYQGNPSRAWFASLDYGSASAGNKSFIYYVRAVRGGS